MKPYHTYLSSIFLFTSSLSAIDFDIGAEFGLLRDSNGTGLVNTETFYAIVYDNDNNGLLPGGLSINQSLTASSSGQAFSSFGGLSLSLGMSIEGDSVVKFGTFNSDLGVAGLEFNDTDFAASGITPTSGRNYAFYWFPGISANQIPLTSFQIGGINETVNYFGAAPGATNFLGTVIPQGGANVATALLDSTYEGTMPDSRLTAIATTPTFQWDTNSGTSGAQGGTGDWNTSSANWNVGTLNHAWTNSGTNNAAVFGNTAGTVTISSGVEINKISFNTTGYAINGASLTLNGATPTVTTASNVTATISAPISGNAGLTKTGAGTLIVSGANSYTGGTAVQSGSLVINGSTAAGNNVTVSAGATLAGTGTVGSSTTIELGAKYSAGALGAVGQQTFSNGLNLQSGSVFEWDLTSASTSSGFDKVIVNGGGLTGSGDFRVVTNLSFGDAAPFWTQTQTWDVVTGTVTGWSNTPASVYDSAGTLRDVASFGSFSITGSSLTWTAVPETSNILIGSLIGLGFLRRRR